MSCAQRAQECNYAATQNVSNAKLGRYSTADAYRANFWNLIRWGMRLSAPRRRFLSSS
jgi:hypothetical protein